MGSIEFENVHFSYTDHGRAFCVLDNINLTVNDGEFLCIIGRSGCGKTTLIRLIAGLQMPDSGKISIDGKPITAPDTDRAVVFQNYTLFPWMTALKNVQFGIKQAHRSKKRKWDRGEIHRIAMDFLTKVGMADFADKYPYQLSGGMCQRVAIARALAMDTDLLLLDEPFGALDTRNRRELQDLLEHLWQSGEKRKTVIFVTHDIAEAVRLGDRILYMTPGKIAADISVSLSRPRNAPENAEPIQALHKKLTELFYENGGMEADDETSL